jgi:hypothetical protein
MIGSYAFVLPRLDEQHPANRHPGFRRIPDEIHRQHCTLCHSRKIAQNPTPDAPAQDLE